MSLVRFEQRTSPSQVELTATEISTIRKLVLIVYVISGLSDKHVHMNGLTRVFTARIRKVMNR